MCLQAESSMVEVAEARLGVCMKDMTYYYTTKRITQHAFILHSSRIHHQHVPRCRKNKSTCYTQDHSPTDYARIALNLGNHHKSRETSRTRRNTYLTFRVSDVDSLRMSITPRATVIEYYRGLVHANNTSTITFALNDSEEEFRKFLE